MQILCKFVSVFYLLSPGVSMQKEAFENFAKEVEEVAKKSPRREDSILNNTVSDMGLEDSFEASSVEKNTRSMKQMLVLFKSELPT